MLFASSRDALKRALTGVAVEVQGTDYSEVAYESGESSFTDRVNIKEMTLFSLGQGQPWSLNSNFVFHYYICLFFLSQVDSLKNPFDVQVDNWQSSPCLSTRESINFEIMPLQLSVSTANLSQQQRSRIAQVCTI